MKYSTLPLPLQRRFTTPLCCHSTHGQRLRRTTSAIARAILLSPFKKRTSPDCHVTQGKLADASAVAPPIMSDNVDPDMQLNSIDWDDWLYPDWAGAEGAAQDR